MNKITDKSKKSDFQSCCYNLLNAPDRAWCVAIFRFFDVNTDGRIDSSDLFKNYNFLEQNIEKVQNIKINPAHQSNLNENTQFKKKIQNRQITQMSQNQQYANKIRTKTKNKFSKQKTDESEKMSEESYQVIYNLMNKNIDNMKILQKCIQQLNQKLMEKGKEKIIDPYNPQSQEVNKDKNSKKNTQQIRYLEQALLKNKDLKFSDLTLILEQMTNQNNKTKKKVIDIDYKKMNIKLSSSYVQTFIATNHNEETRMNRQHLQSLKDSLKTPQKSYSSNSNQSEIKQLPSFKYSQFYEEKLFLPIKNLFIRCLCLEVLDAK